jgi:hypothetical protein
MKLTRKQQRRLAQAKDYQAATAGGVAKYACIKDLTEAELVLNLMNCIDTIEAMDAALHAGADTIVAWRAKPL